MTSDREKRRNFEDLSPNDIWRIYLSEGIPGLQRRAPLGMRTRMSIVMGVLKSLPSDPRCMWCSAPFRGVGAPLMRAIGKGKSKLNPNLCVDCENMINENSGGAEVDLTMLFADVRGSTSLAERMSPGDFGQLINRFYSVATKELITADALIDKLIGDEVTAFFVPGMAGQDHPRRAVDAAKKIMIGTGHMDGGEPWVPVGIGVHSGVAYVGVVGQADGVTDITVLGDVANTASRLASEARTGEIILSETTVKRAGLDTSDLERRELELKGKKDSIYTWIVKVG